jgi:hypothetical protein
LGPLRDIILAYNEPNECLLQVESEEHAKKIVPTKIPMLPIASDDAQPSSSCQSAAAPPTLPYGLDIKYWGERAVEPIVVRNNADCHRFWRPNEDELYAEMRATGGDY